MNTTNYAVVRRHYRERYATEPHAYFSGKIPITVYMTDEITIEIAKKTKKVIVDYMFPQDNKILKIKVYRNGYLSDHKVLTARQQQIDPERLGWMNLTGPMNEVICPVEVQLDREYQAGERVQLTIKITTAFKTIPECKDLFLPCIEFIPISNTFLNAKYWPKKPNIVDSSISYVLPKGFKGVPMTSEGPDFVSEFGGNSFIGWVFRGEEYEYLRHWFVAQISFLYFFLLYSIIPSSGLLVILADCLKMPVPSTIVAMLCGSYFVARYYLYDKTLMPLGGDLVILTTFITLLLSVISDFDAILLMVNIIMVIFPWIAFYLRHRETKRNQEKNDPRLRPRT